MSKLMDHAQNGRSENQMRSHERQTAERKGFRRYLQECLDSYYGLAFSRPVSER